MDIRAEFFHPYFGWLHYEDRTFATADEARVWLQTYQCTPYTRHRVRVVEENGKSRVVWTDSSSPKARKV